MKTVFSRDWKVKQVPLAAMAHEYLSDGECGVKIYAADSSRDWEETTIVFYFKENGQKEPIEISTVMQNDGRLVDASEQNVVAHREITSDPKHLKKLERYLLAALKIEPEVPSHNRTLHFL